jgi:C4-type Zn-finger protein
MAKKKNDKRNSVCIVCGKRLSVLTDAGEIKWHPSHVVDDGFYCDSCFKKLREGKTARKPRTRPE